MMAPPLTPYRRREVDAEVGGVEDGEDLGRSGVGELGGERGGQSDLEEVSGGGGLGL